MDEGWMCYETQKELEMFLLLTPKAPKWPNQGWRNHETLWQLKHFVFRMIVHNDGDDDKDVKELFQQVFKPFWAGVPVVRVFINIKIM